MVDVYHEMMPIMIALEKVVRTLKKKGYLRTDSKCIKKNKRG